MSEHDNIALVRECYAALDRQEMDKVSAIFAPDFRLRFAGSPEMGREQAIGMFGMFFAAFSELQHDIEDIFAAGDRVVTRFSVHGTHQGDLMGIPPTGRPMRISSINIFRIEQGKIAEQWTDADMLGMMQQLGVIPTPGQAA